MSKRVNPSHINIDGAKLKELLESTTGKSLKEISLENGFSDSFLRMVVKNGKATPAAQAVIRRYGIEPSAYEIKPAAPVKAKEDSKQLSIDDLNSINRDELKTLIREALREELLFALEGNVIIKHGEDLKAAIRQVILETPYVRVTGIDYDPKSQRFKLFANKEDLK
jgi:hypothetical protein